MYQTSLNLFRGSEFVEPTAVRKIPKTKTVVIQEAAKVLNSCHPDTKASVERYDTLKAAFVWLCKDIPDNHPQESAKAICNYVRACWSAKT